MERRIWCGWVWVCVEGGGKGGAWMVVVRKLRICFSTFGRDTDQKGLEMGGETRGVGLGRSRVLCVWVGRRGGGGMVCG